MRNIIIQQLPDSITSLAQLYSTDEKFAEEHYCDFDLDIIYRLIPEKVALLSADTIHTEVKQHISELASEKEGDKKDAGVAICKDICRIMEFHPEYDSISKAVESYISCEDLSNEFGNELKSPSVRIRKEAQQTIDSLMEETFSDLSIEFSPTIFAESFVRLLKTGQKEKSVEISSRLVNHLGDASYDFRQKALSILIEIVNSLNLFSDTYLFEKLSQVIIRNLFEKKETFEYSEFIWQIIEKAIVEKDYAFLAKIMHSLYLRRRI